jgi:hypothetical protein
MNQLARPSLALGSLLPLIAAGLNFWCLEADSNTRRDKSPTEIVLEKPDRAAPHE